MDDLARKIQETEVPADGLAIFWLAQAGFVYKTPAGTIIYVDPYLTDCVERLYGFKRIMATPITAEEVEADWVVSTHGHEDHFDIDAIPVLARNPRTRFVGAPDCRAKYQAAGVPADRYLILEKGQTLEFGPLKRTFRPLKRTFRPLKRTFRDFSLTGVYADHGELAPDALGIVLQAGGIKVWQVGDSAYRPDMWQELFQMGIDVLVPPINGAFGNLDGVTAAKLAHDCRARVAIPCHFWMFAEHNGDPAQFMEAMKRYAPEVKPLLLTQGELFVYQKTA
jgi:L-ascorbate 6-phosphate lactonase